ncbi:MarR family transcriptional regulator [Novosphingobium profundi]|uniref:MarR family transcriptional regulator n=1 Tax=Novosphingobium profundi TaxID=1774954 RepID=UPI001BDA2501|nr:MarR family transcriptional regulator [Novosphingobium profundi]MBT0667406.1 MarR family transcriptional regulator [Novosphingobium profundi]
MIEGRRLTSAVNRRRMIGFTEQVQRLRADEFGKELFTIPAFEILLDLYTTKSVQPRSLTSLTGVSSGSERNTQRIVHRLAERGFVDLRRDPDDGRRIIVELRGETEKLLDHFFDHLVELAADVAAKTQR